MSTEILPSNKYENYVDYLIDNGCIAANVKDYSSWLTGYLENSTPSDVVVDRFVQDMPPAYTLLQGNEKDLQSPKDLSAIGYELRRFSFIVIEGDTAISSDGSPIYYFEDYKKSETAPLFIPSTADLSGLSETNIDLIRSELIRHFIRGARYKRFFTFDYEDFRKYGHPDRHRPSLISCISYAGKLGLKNITTKVLDAALSASPPGITPEEKALWGKPPEYDYDEAERYYMACA